MRLLARHRAHVALPLDDAVCGIAVPFVRGLSHMMGRLFLYKPLLMLWRRQSKLSPAQLDELQKATHFDKKELQQWYKGTYAPGPLHHLDEQYVDRVQVSSRTARPARSPRRSSRRSTASSSRSVTPRPLPTMSSVSSMPTTAA